MQLNLPKVVQERERESSFHCKNVVTYTNKYSQKNLLLAAIYNKGPW